MCVLVYIDTQGGSIDFRAAGRQAFAAAQQGADPLPQASRRTCRLQVIGARPQRWRARQRRSSDKAKVRDTDLKAVIGWLLKTP